MSEYHEWTKGFHQEAHRINPDLHPHDRMRASAVAWREREVVALPVDALPEHNPLISLPLLLLVGGAAAVALIPNLRTAVMNELSGIGGHVTGTVSGTTGTASASCPPGSYRRADGQIKTLAQIQSELKGAGYGGPWDTASMVAAYSNADPTGAGKLTAC